MGCAQFGQLVELHGLSENKKRLDAAFVKIETDLLLVDRLLSCCIDGVVFVIKINEVSCSCEDFLLAALNGDDLSSDSGCSDRRTWFDDDSVVAFWESSSGVGNSGEVSVNGGVETPKADNGGDNSAVSPVSRSAKVAPIMVEGHAQHDSVGPEDSFIVSPIIPNAVGLGAIDGLGLRAEEEAIGLGDVDNGPVSKGVGGLIF